MKFSKEDNLKRIADALERISPLPIDNKNLISLIYFCGKQTLID